MAVERDIKAQRVRRWERKRGQDDRDRRLRELMKRKKAGRRFERSSELLLRDVALRDRTPALRDAAAELWEAVRRTKLLDVNRARRSGWPEPAGRFVYGLGRLAMHVGDWVRRPGTWSAKTHNVDRLFASLLGHLLCRYPVPAFFESAWFGKFQRAKRERRWYVRLGHGQSLRGAPGLPIELTRRAAHLLQFVPAGLTVRQGLRWAQLRAMGADDRLVTALLATPVGTDFARDAFWLTVVRFFIDHPMLDREQVGPIVDYLDHRRHVPEPAVLMDGRLMEPGPAEPNLTMRGRSPERLLRSVGQWHRALATGVFWQEPRSWKSCGVPGLLRTEGRGPGAVTWRLTELYHSGALVAEGRALHHCVASYSSSCASGRTAIYSLTRMKAGDTTHELTVELLVKARRVVQARGHCNALPKGAAWRVLGVWAQEAGVELGAGLLLG
ncbi:MAG: PcfJ domain-containing protein [Planctomycetota bacterium]